MKKNKWKHEIIGDKKCVLCSICNLHFDNESNYCPNCGADMKGGGMTDSERIKMLEETVILMCKCLDVQRFQRLSENQQESLIHWTK